jgi:ABC-type branched-subunit amino acid transport system ATPase component
VADRGYVMELGHVIAEGASDVLLQDPRLSAAYLGEATA